MVFSVILRFVKDNKALGLFGSRPKCDVLLACQWNDFHKVYKTLRISERNGSSPVFHILALLGADYNDRDRSLGN